VHIARCVHCHSPRPATGPDNLRRRDMEFGGGRRFETKRYFDEIDRMGGMVPAIEAGVGRNHDSK
jgi:hypothetical protein